MWRNQKGQALVEMALVLPLLLLILMGIIDFGWIFAHKIELQNAVRDGARYASINITEDIDNDDAINDIKNYLSDKYALLDDQKVTFPDFENEDGVVTLKLHYQLDILTPITGAIIGNPFEMDAQIIMSSE